MHLEEINRFSFYPIPSQVVLSLLILNPGWHEQTKDPGVLEHVCWQPPFLSRHSLMSVVSSAADRDKKKYFYTVY